MQNLLQSKRVAPLSRRVALISLFAAASALTGCYVVPLHAPAPGGHPGSGQTSTPVAVPASLTLGVRMYPSNDLASPYGTITGVVVTDLNGRGTFNAAIQGESFAGEATRLSNASREGIANGAGNRGNYLNCRYQMNSTTLGSGQCRLSNGALFSMHIGG